MRPAILSAALLLLAACGEEAPAPAPVEPAPEPVVDPEPVNADPVVEPIMGDCVDLTFTEGSEVAFGTPAVEDEQHEPGQEGHVHNDSHVKHHFEMPEGKDALVVDVTWPAETWTLEVTAGTGSCPHSGKTHASIEGAGSAHLYVPVAALGDEVSSFEAGSSWFVHLATKGEPAAEPVNVTFAAKACVAQKVEAAEEAPAPVEAKAAPVLRPDAAKALQAGPKAAKIKVVKKGE